MIRTLTDHRGMMVFAVTLVAGAASWPSAGPIRGQAERRLLQKHPHTSFQRSDAGIRRAFGQPLSFGDTPRQSAERFKQRHAGVFGVSAADLRPPVAGALDPVSQPLMYDRRTSRYKITLVQDAQYMGGLPVFRYARWLDIRERVM